MRWKKWVYVCCERFHGHVQKEEDGDGKKKRGRYIKTELKETRTKVIENQIR